jgi:hypothetical protein
MNDGQGHVISPGFSSDVYIAGRTILAAPARALTARCAHCEYLAMMIQHILLRMNPTTLTIIHFYSRGKPFLHSWNVHLASSRLTFCIERTALPATVSLGLEADETEMDTAMTHHVLAPGSMLNEHAALRAGTAARCYHPNNVFLLGFSKDAQAMIFVTALLVSTLGGPGISPLVEAMPAEIEATALLLGAKATYQALVFGIYPLTEGLTARAFLNSTCFFQVVFRNFCLKLLLFLIIQSSKTTDFNVAPFLVAPDGGIAWIDVRAEEDEFSGGEKAAAVCGK